MAKTYNIIVIGCQMNKSDAERMSAYLENLGFIKANTDLEADLVILTTCGVRQSAEDRIYGIIPKLKKNNPNVRIVLTGCLSDREDVRERLKDQVDIWLNIKDLPTLKSKLEGIDDASVQRDCDYLKQDPNYSSTFSAFVPIGNGCNNFCTYCVVPHARGREVYRESKEIIAEVKDLLAKGYKEITLIAQNVNSYHEQNSTKDFADLLFEVNNLEGDFWLRFATSHPKDMSDKLIETMAKCSKLCEHLHLPAQAGDDEILARMNRKYKIEHYKNLLKKVREQIPGIAISTDIIVGFPGETREQFENTKNLFEEASYDMAYIAQFSPRPKTAAASLKDDVSREEKKEREAMLMDVLRKTSLRNNQVYLDKELDVLIEGKNKKGFWYGKTRHFKSVKIDSSKENLQGKIIKVKITEVEDFGLFGKY